MDIPTQIDEIERYSQDSPSMSDHDKTVLHAKLLKLRMSYETEMKTNQNDREGLVLKLKKKTLEHKFSQELLKIEPVPKKRTKLRQ